MNQGRPAPVADWVSLEELHRDPYPIYERLRAEGGVHWVPAVNRYLITSYHSVHETELDQEVFSANETGSLQIRAMGHSMLRRDDPEHHVERKAWQPALRPGVVKKTWMSVFERNAERYLAEFIEKGPGADLVWDFAAPYAGENLRELLGFHNVTQQDLQRWSQTMIDATGNYADDPDVWALGEQSYNEVDVALDEMLEWHSRNLDDNQTLIGQLLRSPEELMPLEKIRANMKMSIGGGINEPRDAIGVAAWALLLHPEQRAAVEADPALWQTVFDETVRWVSPIGMYSREVTRDTVLDGVQLPAGARLGICLLAANRDEKVWDNPERFDIRREVQPHLAFGKGTHVCLGAWVAKAEVANVALPKLFSRLEGLDLIPDDPAEVAGWVFRGMTKMPVTWTGIKQAQAPQADASDREAKIAIIGSGPSGSFTAQAVRRVLPNATIDVIEEQPVPFGLLRYGVASDHQGTKSVSRQFERVFLDPNTHLRANVSVGKEITLDQLRETHDAVVVATGMHTDAPLRVPGGQLPGVYGSGRLTRTLNGHPDELDIPHLGSTAVVIGHGNVAIDIARIATRDDFDGSDIDDDLRDEVAGDVRVLHLIGRSAPEAAKFDPVMVRELGSMQGIEHVVHGADLDSLPEGKDARLDAIRGLPGPHEGARMRIEWWFGSTPLEVLGTDNVTGIRIATPDGEVGLQADSVVTAIGFTANPNSLVEPGAYPDGRVESGLYVAGWVRRGPRGTIPDQRTDAKQLARVILEDLLASPEQTDRPALDLPETAVDFVGWRRVDVRERLTAAPGRIRAKLRTRDEQLSAARDANLDIAAADTGGASTAALPMPVTIAFATESGGAELAAEDLQRALADAGDVRLLDLTDASIDDLDPARLHLIFCSTYGDGELPTGVRDWHDELVTERPDLSAVTYAIFGMGDRSYTRTYSRGSEILDEALAACGAQRVGEYGRHDAGSSVDASEAAQDWAEGVLDELRAEVKPPVTT